VPKKRYAGKEYIDEEKEEEIVGKEKMYHPFEWSLICDSLANT
jgi:hypothetical protein